jgi:hypothetical protein
MARIIREEWKDFPLNDNYMVSTHGRVLSKKRPGTEGGILSPVKTEKGYLNYGITIPRKNKSYQPKNYREHYMVLVTWDRMPKEGEECNHLDGNKLNNHISNLEWCSRIENMKHAIETGIMAKRKLYKRKIQQVTEHGKVIATFDSIIEASLKTGNLNTSINNALTGFSKSCGGFIWRYIDGE